MSFCETCGNRYSTMCSSCATLNGVPVKYTEKGSKPIVPICGTCVNKEHCAVAGCNRYEKQLKQTNADRIRNMTDEELAEFLEKHCYQYGWLEWLKQGTD